MAKKKGTITQPSQDDLKSFIKTGKTVDWISEKWNVTPQTVRSWFAKFNLSLPKKNGVKTTYNRKNTVGPRTCPVCQENQNVNYIVAEKHWYCLHCYTEFDANNVIYVYNDRGDLVEVIANKPGLWDKLKSANRKDVIRTITV